MSRRLLPLAGMLLFAPAIVADAPGSATYDTDTTAEHPGAAPRWLDEVRAQRRALARQRRAQLEARRRALDPVGAAQHDAREEAFMRRRQEVRDMIEHDRWLFMNHSLWMGPMSPWNQPLGSTPPVSEQSPEQAAPADTPADWDNGWYFRGW